MGTLSRSSVASVLYLLTTSLTQKRERGRFDVCSRKGDMRWVRERSEDLEWYRSISWERKGQELGRRSGPQIKGHSPNCGDSPFRPDCCERKWIMRDIMCKGYECVHLVLGLSRQAQFQTARGYHVKEDIDREPGLTNITSSTEQGKARGYNNKKSCHRKLGHW